MGLRACMQCQGVRWIKRMEAARGLKVMSMAAPDMLRQLESAVQFGRPVLLVDVGQDVNPVLEPLLAKTYIRWILEPAPAATAARDGVAAYMLQGCRVPRLAGPRPQNTH